MCNIMLSSIVRSCAMMFCDIQQTQYLLCLKMKNVIMSTVSIDVIITAIADMMMAD